MSENNDFKPISAAEIKANGVQALAGRPNKPAQYGVGGLTPAQLKAWFDRLATLLAGRINAIITTLGSTDAAEHIRIPLDEANIKYLSDFISAFASGDIAADVLEVRTSAANEEKIPLQAKLNRMDAASDELIKAAEKLKTESAGKGFSTNDYTDEAKAKVDAIPANPEYTDTVYDDTDIRTRTEAIEGKIPTQADAGNQLADKDFVNSSIATQTAAYISDNGQPFTSVSALNAYTGAVTNLDYAYVTGRDSDGNTFYDRYKATVTGGSVSWSKEFRLNNSSFTAAQWSAISSGITAALVLSYNTHTAARDNPHSVTYEQLGGTKPKYTAAEVGALPASTHVPAVGKDKNGRVYRIDESDIIATYDENGNQISSVYAKKQDIPEAISPTVEAQAITGGTKVTITDKDGACDFYVMNGVTPTKEIDELKEETQSKINLLTSSKADGAFVEGSYLYLTSGDEVIAGPLGPFSGGGGSGGGSSTTYTITLTNLLSGRILNVSPSNDALIEFSYTSVDFEGYADGAGIGSIIINGINIKTISVPQGNNAVNVRDYLSVGANNIKIKVSNSDGSSRTLAYTVNVVSLKITTTLDDFGIYEDGVGFNYTVTGDGTKTVHLLIDGEETGTETITTSGRARTYNIPVQTDGAHYLTVYAETTLQGETIRSNELNRGMIWKSSTTVNPAILLKSDSDSATQGEALAFDYMAYSPLSEETGIALVVTDESGEEYSRTSITVDRTKHTWLVDDYPAGNTVFKIESGTVSASKTLEIAEYVLPVAKVTDSLELEFDPSGRSNGESNPAAWSYGAHSGTFSGFGWNEADGWLMDDDNAPILRFIPGDSMTMSIKPFESDIRETGYTIEAEFATHNVRDYDTVILDCFNGGRGFEIKSQNARLKSEQSGVAMQFKEDSKVRIAFCVEQKNQNRFIYIYVNGIMCNVTQYSGDDNFAQQIPEVITLGATSCGLDLYRLRCYKKALTQREQLDNYIVDRPTLGERKTAYADNDIMGTDETIRLDKLPSFVPVMLIESASLPVDKSADDIIGATVTFTDRQDPTKSFQATNVSLAVQGTSSAGYPVKNMKVKLLKNGGQLIVNGTETTEGYRLKSGIAPIKTICLKADYASSEGANNVKLVDLYNDTCTWKTPAEEEDSGTRQGIAGRPIAVFWRNSETGDVSFIGKYNMNWDKGNPKAFGFTDAYPDAESWEFLDNAVDLCLFKTSDMSNWGNAFEARYPDTKPAYSDLTRLRRVVSWVASTRRDAATGNALSETVTYDGVAYTSDTAEYRLAKFKAEFEDYFVKSSAIFYYLFTEVFLMVDSRAKNMFLTTYDGVHWGFLPYDYDTALGINNEGELVFDYNLEDTDKYAGGVVFNGQESILWNNVRDAFASELKSTYKTLRSNPKFCYSYVRDIFENHQNTWPIALWNEDAFIKYLNPYLSAGTDNLAMLQGSKSSQRDWWLYNGFRYRDSKYEAGDANNYIQMRAFAKDSITITPYSHIYAKVEFGNGRIAKQRATRNIPIALSDPSPDPWAEGTDTVVRIYSADRIASLGDLSGLNAGTTDFSSATKLQSIKLGSDAQGYANTHLTSLTVGNNELLTELDITNCTNMSQTIDLSGCISLETVKAGGTAIGGLTLPNGGHLKSLTLPATMANLTILNQKQFAALTMPSYANITTLRIENTPNIPIEEIIGGCKSGSRIRLIGAEWTATSEESLQATITKLNTCQGIDANGSNTTAAVVTGRVYISAISAELLSEIAANYPQLTVVVNGVPQYVIRFINYDATLLYTQIVAEGGRATDPVISGSEPTRHGTDEVRYAYTGWSSLPTDIHSTQIVTAVYTEAYRVRFYNYDGTLLYTSYTKRGEQASYTGETPTKPSSAQYNYTFYGWTGELTDITEPTDTTATFTSAIRQYTITFINENSAQLQTGTLDYGATPAYNGPTPQHSGTAADWEWIGWTPEISAVTGDATYTAKYKSLLAPKIGTNWHGSTDKTTITSLIFTPDYTPAAYDSTWDASFDRKGLATAYRTGNEVVITWDGSLSELIECDSNMGSMFSNCYALTTLDVSSFDTSNVTDMRGMFIYCKALTSLNLSNFDTSNVTNMGQMFYYCPSLTTLDLSSFSTSNVTNMGQMFYYCPSLTTLDVSNFDTSKVTNMSYMFYNCRALTTLDVSHFDTSKVTNMNNMFHGCQSLTALDLSSFDTSNVTDMSSMFYYCTALTSLDVRSFNTSNVTDMTNMFSSCKTLTTLDVSNFNTSKVTNMGGMFGVCQSLTTLDVSNFNTSKVTDMSSMFGSYSGGCQSLTALDLSSFDTSNVTDMSSMFYYCTALTSLDVRSFNTSNVTDMTNMFSSCKTLTTLDLSSFNTSNVTNMYQMFCDCQSLTTLDVSNFNTSNVTNMSRMFVFCKTLTTLDVRSFNTSNVTNMDSMFGVCQALTTFIIGAEEDTAPQPLMNSGVFSGSDKTIIYVPDSLIDAYKEATNWSQYADKIVGQSTLPAS